MTVVPPSQTLRGREWLTNFKQLEVPFARLLLDSLTVASGSQIRAGLRQYLDAIAKDGSLEQPSLLLVPRKMNEYGAPGSKISALVPYASFSPGKAIPATPGSEGLLGNIIRDLTSKSPRLSGSWIHPEADLASLRRARCRNIILVSDYSGSGTQIVRFAEALLKNRTLRSWHSGGLIRINALVYAAAPLGIQAIQQSKAIAQLWFVKPAANFSTAAWSDEERNQIVSICTSYHRRSSGFQPLGFQSSAGLFVTETTIPNNLPSILCQEVSGWKPFFNRRSMPTELISDIMGYVPTTRDDVVLHSINQLRLAENRHSWGREEPQRIIILILASLVQKAFTLAELATKLQIDSATLGPAVEFLTRNNCIGPDGKTTEVGYAELAAARRKDRRIGWNLSNPSVVYYPVSLR